jgi:hypothetical protein
MEKLDSVHPAMAPRIIAAVVFDEGKRSFRADSPAVLVFFESGHARRFDLSPYLDFGPFRQLTEPFQLGDFSIVNNGGGIAWTCGADASAETLFAEGKPVKATFATPTDAPQNV